MDRYNVVFQNTSETISNGVFTWTSFESKEAFDSWQDDNTRKWYKIIDEGVTEERAVELCSTPEADNAIIISQMREIGDTFGKIAKAMQEI